MHHDVSARFALQRHTGQYEFANVYMKVYMESGCKIGHSVFALSMLF